MPEMFETLMYCRAARAGHHHALLRAGRCDAGARSAPPRNRGVDTTIILPARNDDFAVGATSRSYYAELLAAGVRIYEYQGGLLHTKTLTLDGEVTLIGSANMDRRSFELNYENNILLCDPAVTAAMRERQEQYLADSRRVTACGGRGLALASAAVEQRAGGGGAGAVTAGERPCAANFDRDAGPMDDLPDSYRSRRPPSALSGAQVFHPVIIGRIRSSRFQTR